MGLALLFGEKQFRKNVEMFLDLTHINYMESTAQRSRNQSKKMASRQGAKAQRGAEPVSTNYSFSLEKKRSFEQEETEETET